MFGKALVEPKSLFGATIRNRSRNRLMFTIEVDGREEGGCESIATIHVWRRVETEPSVSDQRPRTAQRWSHEDVQQARAPGFNCCQ